MAKPKVSVVVRTAGPDDIQDIASMVERYWAIEGIVGYSRQRIERLLARLLSETDLGGCWVATADASLCGYLLATLVFSLEHGGLMAEIDELFVVTDCRSAGVGRKLLRAAESELAARGCVRMQLQIGITNDRARAFYERFGYRRRSGYELLDKDLHESPLIGQ